MFPLLFQQGSKGLEFLNSIGPARGSGYDLSREVVEMIAHRFRRQNRDDRGGIFIPSNECFLYPDREQLEFATSECFSPLELVAQQRWGRLFLEDAVRKINTRIYRNQTFTLVANSGEPRSKDDITLEDENTRGSHENYSLPLFFKTAIHDPMERWFDRHGEVLASFLVSRQLICGNGAAWNIGENGCFMLSQRSLFMQSVLGRHNATTTSNRPIVHIKDDNYSHLPSLVSLRMHLICGDANLSDWSIYLKFALTSLILSMIEDGFFTKERIRPIAVVDKVSSMHAVCLDITGKQKLIVTRRDGKRSPIGAIEHQRRFLCLMKQYASARKLHPWETDAIRKYDYVLRCLAKGDVAALSDKLDWAIKKKYLDRFMKRRGIISFADPLVRRWEGQYHEIHPERGLFLKLEKKGLVRSLVSPDDIARAGKTAPSTRALWRQKAGELLKDTYRRRTGHSGQVIREWASVRIGHVELWCRDPLATGIDQILEYQKKRLREVTRDQFLNGVNILHKDADGNVLVIWEGPSKD
jgi:proteasome accessory factor A